MPVNPKAKYTITAEDKTSAGWKSAMRNADNAGKKISGLMKAAFAGVSISAITQAITKAFELGDEIGKLAVKAGVGAREISELSHAAQMFDVEIGALANSIRKMQIATSQAASGNKQYLETFAALGIDLAKFRELSADRQFEAIADAISSIRDPADRARAATELFGRSGAELLPMFEMGARGIREAREEAIALGRSFSEQQVRLLQEGDDAIKKLGAAWDGWMAKLAVGTVKFSQAIDLIDKDRIGELQDQLEAAQDRLSRMDVRLHDDAPFNPELYKRAQKEVAALEAQIKNLQDTYSRGGGPRRDAVSPAAPGYPDAQPKEPSPVQTVTVTASRIEATQTENYFAELQQLTRTQEEESLRSYHAQREALVELWDAGLVSAETYNARLSEMNDELLPEFEVTAEKIKEVSTEMSVFADEAARNMQSAFADFLFDPFEDGMKGMLKSFDTIRRMLAEAAAAKVFQTLFGGGGGGGSASSGGSSLAAGNAASNWFTSIIGGIFGGMRANGGPIEQGKWYIAGEKGREPIWGGGPGAFAVGYPRGAMAGGGGSVTVVNNNTFNNVRDVSDAKMAQYAQRISDATLARVRDEQRRGKMR